MVERKSVASRNSTSFMVISTETGLSALNAGFSIFWISIRVRQRAGRQRAIFPLAILRVPFGKIKRAVAGRKGNQQAGPDRQARHIEQSEVRQHHQERGGCPG